MQDSTKSIHLIINTSCAGHSHSSERSSSDDGLEPPSDRSTDTETETDDNRNKEDNLIVDQRLKSLPDQFKANESQEDSDHSQIRAPNDLDDSYEECNLNKDSKFWLLLGRSNCWPIADFINLLTAASPKQKKGKKNIVQTKCSNRDIGNNFIYIFFE